MNEKHSPASTERSDGTERFLRLFRAAAVIVVGLAAAWFVYHNATAPEGDRPFQLGLDLAGGSHLVYEADTSEVAPADVSELMSVLRDVIERRVNAFGVSEPIVQVEESSFVTDEPQHRLVVELPGVTDVSQAVEEIGKTPLLEFKLLNESALASTTDPTRASSTNDIFIDTGLTGRYFEQAEPVLPQNSQGSGFNSSPYLSIRFNDEGGERFAEITRENVGGRLAIFLDGQQLSSPRINEPITGGRAVITGDFTPEEVRGLAQNLNFGALPLPIALASTQTVGASLGAGILEQGIMAGGFGLLLVVVFMLAWYRLPGAAAAVALGIYVVIMLALFQLIPVTLTAAGLAGFVLSIGMAVDANVLVFERMKEEYRAGKSSRAAAQVGFARAWSAIRDGNVTSLLSAVILFWFGTSIVQGFALVFGLGVIVSMLSALFVTRTLLIALPEAHSSSSALLRKLYHSGVRNR